MHHSRFLFNCRQIIWTASWVYEISHENNHIRLEQDIVSLLVLGFVRHQVELNRNVGYYGAFLILLCG